MSGDEWPCAWTRYKALNRCNTEIIFIYISPANEDDMSLSHLTPDDTMSIPYNMVNISSDYGLVLDSTKSVPEPMLTHHQWGIVAFTWPMSYRKFHTYQSLICRRKSHITNCSQISQGPCIEQFCIIICSFSFAASPHCFKLLLPNDVIC